MADLLWKTALLSILLVALLIVIVVQLCQLLRQCRARPRKKQTKKDCGGRRVRKGMGDDNLHGGHMYGMGSAPTNGVPDRMRQRFDPALYAHLPSYMQPLPDDEDWVPPPSTLPLAWGSTQTSYETGGRSGDRGTGMGPMSTLLTGGGGAGVDPLQLHLSPSCGMDASRTVLVEHSSRSQGGVSVTMQDAREDGPHTQRPARSSSACTSSHSRPPGFTTPVGTGVPHAVVDGRVTTATAAKSPQVIERIKAHYSRMRTDVQRDDGGDTCGDGEDVAEDCTDDDDESDDDGEPAVKEPTSKGGKNKASKSRAKSKAREKGGGADGEGGGGSTRQNWHLDESLVLVRCKRDLDEYMASQGSNFARMKTKTWKWNEIAKRMVHQGVTNRDGESCMKRWENIFGWYKKIWDREKDSGVQSFFVLTSKKRKELGFKFAMDRQLYDAIHATTPNNQAIHPPNLHDTGGLPPQQANEGDQSQPRGPTAVGETSASDNMESGAGDGYGNRSSGGTPAGKRKNARQMAFDAVANVMKTHSTAVAESVDRASKRQCDVLQRQCDIMEREARMQEKQCEVLDAGQRMLCDALLKIASALSRS
ncbi:hypothetical protein CBR_g2930 [Chara braunii]|uniref:Myb-like domain-containing protein n=1 Tax=Chara braunii TaxID=69332 RepID=A0A388KEF7_CHABU|nr:hypothetical protein CBR_g2930 [Chara braunii]|eukprot:GBG68387.1 hypothetical protein CBR_g2930 [Chara braunii]